MDNSNERCANIAPKIQCENFSQTRKAAASWIYAETFEPRQATDILRPLLAEVFPDAKPDDFSPIVKLEGNYKAISPELIDAFSDLTHAEGYVISPWREAVMRVLIADLLACIKTPSAPLTEDAVMRITDELGASWRGTTKNACQLLSGLRTRMRKTMRALVVAALYMRAYRPYLAADEIRGALESLVRRCDDGSFFDESFPFGEFLEKNGDINVKGNFVISAAVEAFYQIYPNIDALDEIIQKSSRNWRVSRMTAVDLNILRMAVYELMFEKLASPRSVINEAVEIAKSYSAEASRKFVNGILQQVCIDNRIAMG